MPTLTTLREQAVSNLLKLLQGFEPVHQFLPGILGNAVGVVDVPGRSGYVYVRLLGDPTRTIRARNMGVLSVADATVWVENVGNPGDRERYRVPLLGAVGEGETTSTSRITAASTPYSAPVTDNVIFCNTDDGAIGVTLPSGLVGAHCKVVNCGSSGNDVTISGSGVQKVMGVATQTLADGEVLDLHFNTIEHWW